MEIARCYLQNNPLRVVILREYHCLNLKLWTFGPNFLTLIIKTYVSQKHFQRNE